MANCRRRSAQISSVPLVLLYGRKSFERLGDDLTKHVLSYLPLKDRLGFECVSKQWKRLLQDNDLDIIDTDFNTGYTNKALTADKLKQLLKRVQNIRAIELTHIPVKDSLLSTITDCCPLLDSIGFDLRKVSEEAIVRFGQRLGHRIRKIRFFKTTIDMKKQKLLLSFCPNVKTLIGLQVLYYTFDNDLALDLAKTSQMYLNVGDDSAINCWKGFVDKYENKVKHLSIDLVHTNQLWLKYSPDLLEVIRLMSRFVNLKSANLSSKEYIIPMNISQLEEQFDLMATNCRQLKSLSFAVTFNFQPSFDFFRVFTRFQTITELNLSLDSCVVKAIKTEFEPLKALRRLAISCPAVDDSFFALITRFAPNLQILRIISSENITNYSLDCLMKMKALSELTLKSLVMKITDPKLLQFLDNCRSLKYLSITFKTCISGKKVAKLIAMAIRRPDQTIDVRCYNTSDESADILRKIKYLPKNLIITTKVIAINKQIN